MDTGIEKKVPSFGASSSKWVNFHKELRKIFSKKEANTYWVKAWINTGGDAQSTANTKELRDYMAKQGVQVEANNFIDAASDYLDDFSEIATVWVTIAMIVIIAAVSLGIFMKISRSNPQK